MIHKKIKQLRLQNNFTQEEMAEAIFCSQNTYSLIENGKTMLIDVERIKQIAKKLRVKPQQLLEGAFDSPKSRRSRSRLSA